jgi:hypothetical protein
VKVLLAPAIAVAWLAATVTASPAAGARPHEPTAPATTIRYADGAPPGFSGAFGENSCHACHFDADVNTTSGRLTIEGVPARFAAGTAYPLRVTLHRAGMLTGGFQLTARFKDGGAQAGPLAVGADEQERVKIDVQAGVQYANQRSAGAAPTSATTAAWTVLWTAPASGGTVQFHAAANAGNKDDSANGDHVFTAVRESEPAER